MRRFIMLLLFVPIWSFGHTSQISTFAIVKDEKGLWTAHLSSSLSAFQIAIEGSKMKSNIAFQEELIDFIQNSIQIKSGFINSISLTEGQCIIGHQTDVKFKINGMPQDVRSLTVENLSFKKLHDHFMVFKVVVPTSESNQIVLESKNNYSAEVEFTSSGIFIKPKSNKNYYFILFIPLAFVCLKFLKKRIGQEKFSF